MQIKDVTAAMEKYAPTALAESFDNVGLMVGDASASVEKILLTLDVDLAVAQEAHAYGANLIISHHPLIFNPLKSITADTAEGRCLLYLIEHKIAVYSAHTNLDSAAGGLNDLAAQFLGLSDCHPLEGEEQGLGRVGILPTPMTLAELATMIKKLYRLPCIRFSGNGETEVSRVALCTGGGSSLTEAARKVGADVYISGDIKYSAAREAAAEGLPIIELGHYDSEYIVVNLLEKIIRDYAAMNIELFKSKANKNVFGNVL